MSVAQEQTKPRFFVEFTAGPGSVYIDKVIFSNHIGHVDMRKWFVRLSPSVGVNLNARWTAGIRITADASGGLHGIFATKRVEYTGFSQYDFINIGRWSINIEGKVSYSHNYEKWAHDDDYGEIGFSLGCRYVINNHFSLVARYLYTGLTLGHYEAYRDDLGCIHTGRYRLDFGLNRLQIGARYTF